MKTLPNKFGNAPRLISMRPDVIKVGMCAKKDPDDSMDKMRIVEKGKEKARSKTASSRSKVLFSLGTDFVSSRKLNAEICASGQKLAALNGITIDSRIIDKSVMFST